MSTLHVTDGSRTTGARAVPAAQGLVWFVASSLWLVVLTVRLQGDVQVLVGPGVLALWAVAVLANAGWGVLLGRRAAWHALVTSVVVGAAVAVVAAVVWAVTAFAGSGDVNPEALWAVVPVLTVGVWAVLLTVLVLSALVGVRTRRPAVSPVP